MPARRREFITLVGGSGGVAVRHIRKAILSRYSTAFVVGISLCELAHTSSRPKPVPSVTRCSTWSKTLNGNGGGVSNLQTGVGDRTDGAAGIQAVQRQRLRSLPSHNHGRYLR